MDSFTWEEREARHLEAERQCEHDARMREVCCKVYPAIRVAITAAEQQSRLRRIAKLEDELNELKKES